MGNVGWSFGCFYRFLIYTERLITIQYFSAPVLFYHCYFWQVWRFGLQWTSGCGGAAEIITETGISTAVSFYCYWCFDSRNQIPPVHVSECRLCLCHLNLFSSVHPGPLPPVVSDADSLSQTSAPLSAHFLLLVLSLTHFDSPGSPQHPQ